MFTNLPIGAALAAFGWSFMVIGIALGSFSSMYAFAGPFSPPKGHENYSGLPRRLFRLAHIAAVALPLITIVYSSHIDGVTLSQQWKLTGAYSMVIATIGIPSLLIVTIFYNPAKYAEFIPVSAMFLALGIIAWGYINPLIL